MDRLDAYDRRPAVAEYYARKGRLVSVNGDLPVNQVTDADFKVIESQRAGLPATKMNQG